MSLGVSIGDLDGDGDLDLICADNTSDSIWLNNGEGTFTDSGRTLDTVQTLKPVVGDFNGDGDLDFLAIHPTQVHTIWFNVALPTLGTASLSQIGSLSATVSAAFSDAGDESLDDHGFVWSDEINPDLSDSVLSLGSIIDPETFTGQLNGLTPARTYYVRAYASNTAGTAYSNQVMFTTLRDNDRDGTPDDADPDDDNDGVPDISDAFPFDPSEHADTDHDTIGNNADADDDNDGVLDDADAFPLDPTESLDTDQDGIGNNADPDDDGDGVNDTADRFPLDDAEWVDTDNDGIGDNADLDDDDDGVPDSEDAFPLDNSETLDTDRDGTGNETDLDDDNDGVADWIENQGPNRGDGNHDATPDALQSTVATMRAYGAFDYMILESGDGVILSNCRTTANPSPSATPPDTAFPQGFIHFTIQGFANGEATVQITLPETASPSSFFIYTPSDQGDTGTFNEFLYNDEIGAGISGKTLTLHLKDGLTGDSGEPNDGIIHFLGAPARTGPDVTSEQQAEEPAPVSGDKSGCFISSSLP